MIDPSLETFLSELYALDIKLWLDDGQLRVRAPKGTLTPDLRASLADRKPEILAFLSQVQRPVAQSVQPIPSAPRNRPLPLSLAQHRLWVADQIEGPNSTYNIRHAVRLQGTLNIEALHQAFSAIIHRHEVLRTRFVAHEAEPRQVVEPEGVLSIQMIDISRLSPAQQEVKIEALIATEADRPFDLTRLPLMRVTLIQCHAGPNRGDYRLLTTMHHIISDGWSMMVFAREFEHLYEAARLGNSNPLPPLTIQYADYAVWQRNSFQSNQFAEQLAYWQQQLKDIPKVHTVPTDHLRPPIQSSRGAAQSRAIDQGLLDQLKALAHQHDATLSMVLYGGFALLLSRYSGQADILIGSSIANRHYQAIEPLIGFFVNLLPGRTNLVNNPTISGIINQVRQTMLDAYANQDIPIDKLIEQLQIERDPAFDPLLQIGFAFQNYEPPQGVQQTLEIIPIPIEVTATQTDLLLFADETGNHLDLLMTYRTDLFEAKTIDWLLADFVTLLEAMVTHPQQTLTSLWETTTIERPPWLSRSTPEERSELSDALAQSNLTKSQFLFWLGQQLEPETPIYNTCYTYTIEGDIDLDHFQQAFQALITTTDIFRTIIDDSVQPGVPQQHVVDTLIYQLPYIDVSDHLSPDEAYEQWRRKQLKTPLDLAQTPFEAALIKVAPQKHIWFVKQHHALIDGLSANAVTCPLFSELYTLSVEGKLTDSLIERPSYQTYVATERAFRQSNDYQVLEKYWQQKLAEPTPALTFYGQAPTGTTRKGNRYLLDLGLQRTHKLKAISQAERLRLLSLL
ncbi:MAG: condensation domain-containing protein, partial [Chloroflexota bacterium]